MSESITVEVTAYEDLKIDHENHGWCYITTTENGYELKPDETRKLRDALNVVLGEGPVEAENEVIRRIGDLEDQVAALQQLPIVTTVVNSPGVEASNAPEPVDDVEATLRSYIELRIPAVIDYTKESGERGVRTVSPYLLTKRSPWTTLTAWDHDRQGYRNFALRRIHGIGPAAVVYRNG